MNSAHGRDRILGSYLNIGTTGSGDSGSLGSSIVIDFRYILDSFTIGKTAEAISLDLSLMDKDIWTISVRDNEAEAFHGVEPFDGSSLGVAHEEGSTANSRGGVNIECCSSIDCKEKA